MYKLHKREQTASWLPYLLWIAITGLWMASTAYLHIHVLKAAFSAGFLLLVPGFFLYRSIIGVVPRQMAIKTIAYSVGLSLFVLMIGGLLVNELLFALGNNRPLTAGNTELAVGLITSVMITISQLRSRLAWPVFRLRRIQNTDITMTIALLALPLMAIGGANTLNNGGGNWLTMTVFGLVATGIIVGAWQKGRLNRYIPYLLYSLTLSVLLATSLRGWFITGHDIMQEYQVFQLTLGHHAWHMAYYQDAYNACLSITILPTILQQLTGISDPYIYKFLFQIFSALLAPAMYFSLRPYVKRTIAFLAAILFVTFPTFITDMTMLNRQEVALLTMLLAIMAGLDRKLSRRARSLLSFILLSAMILSHYSTSYVTIGVLVVSLAIGFGMQLLTRLWKRLPRPQSVFAIFRPGVIVASLMVLLLWNTFATQTSNNIAQTLKGVEKSIPLLLSGKGLNNSAGKLGSTGSGLISQYNDAIIRTRSLPTQDYYPSQVTKKYPLYEKKDAQTSEPKILNQAGVPYSGLKLAFGLSRTAYGLLIEGLIPVGLLLLTLRRVRTRLPLQYTTLGAAGLIVIAAQVVLPSDVINYGLLRVLQQALLLLAAPIVLAALWILGLMRIPETGRLRIFGLILALFFLILSGFIPALTGGDKPSLALSNDGFYYQAYLTHADEVAADQWLQQHVPVGSRVYADEFARRKMIPYSGIYAQPTLVPSAIPVDSYVYLSHGDTAFDKIPVYYKGQLTFYSVPYHFLNDTKNLVYTSGGVEIYK